MYLAKLAMQLAAWTRSLVHLWCIGVGSVHQNCLIGIQKIFLVLNLSIVFANSHVEPRVQPSVMKFHLSLLVWTFLLRLKPFPLRTRCFLTLTGSKGFGWGKADVIQKLPAAKCVPGWLCVWSTHKLCEREQKLDLWQSHKKKISSFLL